MQNKNDTEIKTIREKLLDKIFINGEKITKIETIGGMTNKNYLIEVNGEKLIIRNPGKGSDRLIDRKNEHKNIKKIASLNIDTKLFYFNENTGVKITKFIEDAETINPKTAKNNLFEISEVLKKLHKSDIRFDNKFSVFDEIKKYENKIKMNIENIYSDYSLIKKKIFKLEEKLQNLVLNFVSCHNDTVAENFIKSPKKKKIFLIDWEYSGLNEAEWDLAAFCIETSLSKEEEKEFLNYYYENKILSVNLEKILIYKILQDFLWSLWTIVKFESGVDFGNYGLERYNRCIKFIGELEKNVK